MNVVERGGAHGTLFIGRGGEVRGRGRQDCGGRWAASMVTIFEKGGARVPLDEANRGGMGGTSLRLHHDTGGRWWATRRAVASQGVAARLFPRRKTVPGWAIAGPKGLDPKADWAELPGDMGPFQREMVWATRRNGPKLGMGCKSHIQI
jgi:hypothetical protein